MIRWNRNRLFGALLLLSACCSVWSCTTQKNTVFTRFYHNLNAHYNVYFNAEVAYANAEKVFDKSVKLDYDSPLPVFLQGSKDSLAEALPTLKKAIEKSYSTVQHHSIKVKPSLPKGKMSPQEKAFYARTEYCNYIDDAYLTIGRSQAYMRDFAGSKLAFGTVVSDFPQEASALEAQLWLALIAIKSEDQAQADLIFIKLDKIKTFPASLRFLYAAVRTELALTEKDYPKAEEQLTIALKEGGAGKIQKQRMRFLQAQLFELNNQRPKAYDTYKKLLRDPDISYEMQFNARLRMASLAEGSGGEKLKKILMRMAEDPRNKQYLDRIWTVLGKLSWQEGDKEKAKEYYANALETNNISADAKLKIYQELLNGYFKERNYVMAYPVLKQMLSLMKPDHVRYSVTEALYAKYKNLGESLEVIQRNDSLIRMASLPEDAKTLWAKSRSEQYAKEKFEREKRAAEAAALKKTEKTEAGQFYFYNKTLKEQGKQTFDKRWGARRLEDGWRRADQRLATYTAAVVKMKTSTPKDSVFPKKNDALPGDPQYYLNLLPSTPQMVQQMKAELSQAYLQAGRAYVYELKEVRPGVKLWEKCMTELSEQEAGQYVAFELAKYYAEVPEPAKVEEMKSYLQKNFPNALTTQQLCNPAFLEEMTRKYKKEQELLDKISILFLAENYAQVLYEAPLVLKELPKGDESRKVELMQALSTGIKGPEEYAKALQQVAKQYIGTEEGDYARSMLTGLGIEKPRVEEKKVQGGSEEKEPQFLLGNAPYYFAVVVHQTAKVNQLKFNINVLNADRFKDTPLPSVFEKNLKDERKIVCCGPFPSEMEARRYLQWVRSSSTDILNNVGAEGAEMMIISVPNLKLLEQWGKSASYIKFYREKLQ